mmetsp:Transcript_6888/g.12074  ORF Transcript_6888/g.12074 Transcript_6888/m.12074 type:complete len:86 (-) Transcript_6888:7-264(-)
MFGIYVQILAWCGGENCVNDGDQITHGMQQSQTVWRATHYYSLLNLSATRGTPSAANAISANNFWYCRDYLNAHHDCIIETFCLV